MDNAKKDQGEASAIPCFIPAICAAWLTANGYDGLCNTDIECGCSVIDLMPCDSPGMNSCVPAHKELQDDGDWLMFPGKANSSMSGQRSRRKDGRNE
jgi:hypothetical protein